VLEKETDSVMVKLGDFGEYLFQFMQYSSTQVSNLWGIPSKKGMRRATTPFLESGPMPKANCS